MLIILLCINYCNWQRVAKTALGTFGKEAMGRNEAKANEGR